MERPLTPHTHKILGLLHCTKHEAHMVEQMLRDQGYLGEMRDFNFRARQAKRVLDDDPELRQLLKEELFLA